MMVLTILAWIMAALLSGQAWGQVYKISVPEFYIVFSGDLEFNYSIPGHMALPNGFVKLEFWSQNTQEHVIITTMGLRLGYNTGTLRVACGVVEFAGTYTLRMLTRVNGETLTTSNLTARWPEVGLSLPDHHEAQTSSVELRIISGAKCDTLLQRNSLLLKLLFRRSSNTLMGNLTPDNSDVIYRTNFTSVSQSYTTVTMGCHLFDLDGWYQVQLVSSALDSPVVAVSNLMQVTWSKGYHLSFNAPSAFPCPGSLGLLYTHPPCSGLAKLRLYSYTPSSPGSPASPMEAFYVTEMVADLDRSRLSLDCSLFNQSASGFCVVYVSVTRTDVISEQAKVCLPAQANSDFPIDGNWSKWTSWTSCSVTCGTGRKSRFRVCNEPAPKHGGRFCVGDPVEWTPCEVHCPESIPRTPLHSPAIDPNCSCGCTRADDKGQIIGTGRCHGLSSWMIKGKDGDVVALRFDYFSLNFSRQWVKVRDGESPGDVLLFSSSIRGYPLEIVTSGPAMRVELMTNYVTPPPAAIFPKNATLPIHAHGFIATYEIRATLMSSTAAILFQYKEETVMSSTITIVGIVLCAVVIIVAVVFVVVQRTFFRRRIKYMMTSSGDSPVHQSQAAGSSTEHRASSAPSSSPSSPGHAINVDMEVPLTGKTQRKIGASKTSRASSTSSAGSNRIHFYKTKTETASVAKGANNSPKPANKDFAPITSPYGIEIIDIDETSGHESKASVKLKSPKTTISNIKNHKQSPITPVSPVTKLDMLNKKRIDKKGKGVNPDTDRDVTGSSGSRSPPTTKAEVNWCHISQGKAALNEFTWSVTEKRKQTRPPSEEIPLLDSMTSSQESPSHFNFNNMVKSESTDSATTSFVRPLTNKIRRPTSLTESYSSETGQKTKLSPQGEETGAATLPDIPTEHRPQGPAIIPVKSVQLSTATSSSSRHSVNTKPQLRPPAVSAPPIASTAASSAPLATTAPTISRPQHPVKQHLSSQEETEGSKYKKTASEERQTILPKPDGQSPKFQRRENGTSEPVSPGKASRTSSKSSKHTVSSPARSLATPSEIEGLELEYDDFVEDDPLSYFDYEETQKLAFRGVEKLGKTPVEEEEEDDV